MSGVLAAGPAAQAQMPMTTIEQAQKSANVRMEVTTFGIL